MTILLIICGFSIALVIILVASNWYFSSMMRIMVSDVHQALEVVTESGTVPPQWSSGYDKVLAFLQKRNASSGFASLVRKIAKHTYLRKLKKLQRYVRTTSLVETETVRQIMLDSLKDVRGQWEAM